MMEIVHRFMLGEKSGARYCQVNYINESNEMKEIIQPYSYINNIMKSTVIVLVLVRILFESSTYLNIDFVRYIS